MSAMRSSKPASATRQLTACPALPPAPVTTTFNAIPFVPPSLLSLAAFCMVPEYAQLPRIATPEEGYAPVSSLEAMTESRRSRCESA